MPSENMKKFEAMLQADPVLQAKLEDFDEAFDGDMTDERAFLAGTVCKVAEEAGLPFSADEAQEVFGEHELSDV